MITQKRRQAWDRFQDRIFNDEAYRIKIRARLLSKVDQTHGCWVWVKERSESGYGLIKFAGASSFRAHRVFYIVFKEERIAADLCVLHHCDNPPCCNPDHLFKGTRRDNAEDRDQKGRGIFPGAPGERNGSAKLNPAQIGYIIEHFTPNVKSGEHCLSRMAQRFGVTKTTIRRIVSAEGWSEFGGCKNTPKNFLTQEQQLEIFNRFECGNNHGPNCRSSLAKEFGVDGYKITNVIKKFRLL